MTPEQEFTIPQPVELEDYYVEELRRYTVSITIDIPKLVGSEGDVCYDAVAAFRAKEIDGSSEVMHSELIKEVELDFKTDLPFDRAAWQMAKLSELGIDAKGNPLRPGDRIRPDNETTFTDFR